MTTPSQTKGVADIGIAFEAFCANLRKTRSGDIDAIGVYGNGFEGWLKFEFLFYLANTYGLKPREGVGVEPHVALTTGGVKQCDLWAVDATGLRYHYVELKAYFNNGSKSKMSSGARNDLFYMATIDAADRETSAATGSAIRVGVGFDRQKWDQPDPAVQALQVSQGIPINTRTGSLSASVHWSVWTRSYAQPRD